MLRRRKIYFTINIKPKVKRKKGTFKSKLYISDFIIEVFKVNKARAEGYNNKYKAIIIKFKKGGY
jgi:hypothetical protein